MVYTKDRLIKEFIDTVKKNTEAFDGVKEALNNINDQNTLHVSKDDARAEVVKKLVDGNEKFYKVVTYILLISVGALVVLAGAEEVLKIIPFL